MREVKVYTNIVRKNSKRSVHKLSKLNQDPSMIKRTKQLQAFTSGKNLMNTSKSHKTTSSYSMSQLRWSQSKLNPKQL